jgi:inorganic phosphate transporter, PiT family
LIVTIPALLLIAVALLSFWNGANDVSKGIATLVGSGVTRLKTAIIFGTICTVAGSLTAAIFAGKLIKTFSGSGIVPDMPDAHGFRLAVAIGAVAWVAIATLTRLPVSTTHSITGALIGAGVASVGIGGLAWDQLLHKFVIPLAVSPILALVLMYLVQPVFSRKFAWLEQKCVCVGTSSPKTTGTAVALESEPIVVGESAECDSSPVVAGRFNLLDGLHWLSSGTVSFARGLNDAPKILGLGLAASLALNISPEVALLIVAAAMGLGSLLAGFRVTETLANRVTPMTPANGCAANIVTGFLVIVASRMGAPVSTTHVSTSAIIGMGLKHDAKAMQWKTVRDMLLAWVVTLPVAAIIGALMVWLL